MNILSHRWGGITIKTSFIIISAVLVAALTPLSACAPASRAAELTQDSAVISPVSGQEGAASPQTNALEQEGAASPQTNAPELEGSLPVSSAPQSAEPSSEQMTQPQAAEGTVITAGALCAEQGGLITLHAEGLPEGVLPVVSTELSYTPVFFSTGSRTADALLAIRSGTEVGSYALTVTAGESRTDFTVEVADAGFSVQYFEMDETVAADTLYNNEAAEEFEALYQRMKSGDGEIYWDGAFILPLELEPLKISSNFGDTRYVNGKLSGRHGGVDFPAPMGTPVLAVNSGKVAFAGFMQQTGNTVCIEHGLGLKSWYFHMDSLSCATGDMLATGDEVGKVGTTGASTGNHLHLSFSVGGVYVSPWLLIDGDVSLPSDSE